MQLKRLHELEDIVADQDNSIAALREKLTRARQDTADWRYKYEQLIKTHGAEKERWVASKLCGIEMVMTKWYLNIIS